MTLIRWLPQIIRIAGPIMARSPTLGRHVKRLIEDPPRDNALCSKNSTWCRTHVWRMRRSIVGLTSAGIVRASRSAITPATCRLFFSSMICLRCMGAMIAKAQTGNLHFGLRQRIREPRRSAQHRLAECIMTMMIKSTAFRFLSSGDWRLKRALTRIWVPQVLLGAGRVVEENWA